MRRVLGVIGFSPSLRHAGRRVCGGNGPRLPAKSAASADEDHRHGDRLQVQALEAERPKAGHCAFKVVNKGKVGHDFKIAGKKTKLIAAGKTATLTVKFAKKGRFATSARSRAMRSWA